ncbi:hypothetical protein D3C73_1558890 [compost metagenome]
MLSGRVSALKKVPWLNQMRSPVSGWRTMAGPFCRVRRRLPGFHSAWMPILAQ